MTSPNDPSHELIIQVMGAPKAQPRPRWRGTRQRPVAVIDPNVRLWQLAVERAGKACLWAVNEMPWLGGPLELDMQFRFKSATPVRHGRPHEAKPDKDNVEKLVMDCLERVGLLPKGDQRVTSGKVTKIWAPAGGATITIRSVSQAAVANQAQPLAATHGSPEWLSALVSLAAKG